MSINAPSTSLLPRSAFYNGQLRHAQLSASARRPHYAKLHAVAALQDKGQRLAAGDIQVKSSIGEGSYGQVFEGWLARPEGRERVVLKRVKTRVEGALEMGEMEHLLNVYASRSAPNSIADFVGYAQVGEREATRSLTEGLWLAWRFEGGRTLAHYLRRRDCIQRLAEDMDVPQDAVVRTVMRHIFEGLSGLHAAGLVHRDVKPLNIIFAEEQRRFKLIDLGACADLRTGTNYTPDESILDPTYCPPEQYCMPTDSPHLARQLKPLAIAMSPLLWSRFKPDRFDSYSCGLVLLQLAIPRLRSSAGIKQFNLQYKKARFNLQAWLDKERLPPKESAILDTDAGVGWDLAAALLRPRDIQVDDRGGVVFVNKGGAIRLPVKAALDHKFLRKAKTAAAQQSRRQGDGSRRRQSGPGGTITAPGRPPSEPAGVLGSAVGFWRAASDRLKDLDLKLSNQERAVAIQTGKVEMLKATYADGRVKKDVLDRQQSLLGKMTGRLNKLQGELGATSANAQRVLSFLGPKDKLSNQARAVTLQRGKVEVLKADFATGKVKRGELDRQKSLLGKMTNRLGSLQDELNTKAAGAQRIFSFLQPKQREGQPPLPSQSVESEVAASPPQSNARRILNAFLRADRLEASLLTELDSDTEEGRRRGSGTGSSLGTGSGSNSRRSTPDGNVSDSGTGSTRRRFRLFGQRETPEEPAPAPTASTSRNDLPPSLLKRSRQSTGTNEQRATTPPGDRDAGTGSRSITQTAAGAAVTGIYAGLKLTGFALRVATDMATSLSKDAEQAFAKNEAQRVTKRQQRMATNAFLELLRECEPPVRAQSKWTGVRRFVAKDPRFAGLDEDQRSAIFADYAAELARLETARLRRGEETFKELLAEAGLTRESTLDAVEARLESDPRFTSLPDSLDMDRVFADVMEVRVPEFDFWDLLRECRSPPLTRDTTWGQARRQIAADPRFEAISERQRRAVFRTFVDSIKEPETAPACLLPTASMNLALGSGPAEVKDVVEASKESLSSLQVLRAEQMRLQSEYRKMEAKLQDMEKKLQGQDSSSKNASMGRKQLGRDINGNLQHNLLQRGSGD